MEVKVQMAAYTVISDVGAYLLKTLRGKLCPEPLLNPQAIDFASPADENADYTLGIFLYDLKENLEHTDLRMVQLEDNKLRYPPHSLTLYYMLYVNASAQIGVKALDSQKIIAKVAQVIYDMQQIDISSFVNQASSAEAPLARVVESRLLFDEKVKIWSALSRPVQLALYYDIAPILLSSERIVDAPYVMRGTYKFGGRR
ncbi:MAG: DUF4255 domain-containing protein [Oscillospiraceae bacterium]|jgi:hypothetical protein|nr:DUF4255 domain-containing protein [Oscillospiraceae bacterium]